MATHAQNIANLRNATYGEQVRGSMIELFEEDYTLVRNGVSVGTAISAVTDPITGFSDGNVYINSNTWKLFRVEGNAWVYKGTIQGEQGASVTGAVDNEDGTFYLTFSDGTQSDDIATIQGVKGDKGDDGETGRSVTSITMSGTGKQHPITATYSDGTTQTVGIINDGNDGSGIGDMLKSTYDISNNGYVDKAAALTDGTNTMPYSTVANKADRSTTLSGYGITNAYTKSEVDTSLGGKISEPSSDGSNGQALLTDGNGNRYWGDVGADYIKSVETSQFGVSSAGKLSLDNSVTSKLVNLDSDGEISGDHVNYDANNTVNDKIDGLETSKADKTELDSWHKYNNVVEEVTVNTTGDSSVAFHGLDTSKTYGIYFDTADGSQPNFKGSLLTGTTMTYTVNISSTDALPAKFRLAVKNSLS